MQTVSITTAKARLNELVDDASTTHEHVTITKNGEPAAVIISAAEWDSIQESLFWMAQPDIHQAVDEARALHLAGDSWSEDQVRERFAAPRRTAE